jgi:hypothetical protein
MPFGLRNAPATFQRVHDIILSGVRDDFALIYLDDIIVFSSSFSQHGTFIHGIETAIGRKHFVEYEEMSFREVRGSIPRAHDTTPDN